VHRQINTLMEATEYIDHRFEKAVYAGEIISGKEFESCTFKNCDFSNSQFLKNKFLDCTFENCNLSMMKLAGSTLSNAGFSDCKLLGIIFSECQDFLFSVGFKNCILDYSSFFGKKLPKTKFIHSSLKEVNFTQANLSGAVFDLSDLSGTIFNDTDLREANFVTAFNYSFDPEFNLLRKASFSADGIGGLLTKYEIKIV